MSTLIREGKFERKESGSPSSSSWKLSIIFCREEETGEVKRRKHGYSIKITTRQTKHEDVNSIHVSGTWDAGRETDLGLGEVLLAVRLAVFLLHEGNPAQLALLDERLDVHGAESVAADPFVVLQHKAVLGTQRQEASHQPASEQSDKHRVGGVQWWWWWWGVSGRK